MRVLLIRPKSPNERFGLGPFFQVEPLGLEYVGADLLQRGHAVQLVDLRFGGNLHRALRRFRPQVVGISCTHAVDIPEVLSNLRRIQEFDSEVLTVVGGHSASVFPKPFDDSGVNAVCITDGELAMGELVDAYASGAPVRQAGQWHGLDARFAPASAPRASPAQALNVPGETRDAFERVALPARHLVEPFRRHYFCVHKRPIWAVETARGCPFRCNFCSTWRRHERSFRCREIDTVCEDLEAVGDNVFIVDDLFFYPARRSIALAKELRRRGIRKDWILVQSRLDTVARHSEVLEAWRPLARQFDIFFGFEAATNQQLQNLDKDLSVDMIEEGVRIARHFNYGITGNFVVDPEWEETDFEAMWSLVDRLGLDRLGYTVLTPLPGTLLYDSMLPRLLDRDYSHFDMHHVLYEPELGRQRFFELFVESWRRNVLSARHSKSRWWRWVRGLSLSQIATLGAVLYRTQRMLDVKAYLRETFPLQLPAIPPQSSGRRRQSTSRAILR